MTNNLLTTVEAAEYLGMKKSYLHKLMMKKEIPFYKPNGKLCFFDKDELDQWLRRILHSTTGRSGPAGNRLCDPKRPT